MSASLSNNRFQLLPATRTGQWGVGVALAGFLLMLAWTVLPGGGAIPLAFELVGGTMALVAIVRHGERALSVIVALIPFLLAVVFVIAEIVEIISGL